MRTTLFFLFSLAYLLFVSCEEEKVDALQEQPKAQKMIHQVNLECIISNIHHAPDSLRSDTAWVKAELFKCVNQSFEEFGFAPLNKVALEEAWQDALLSLKQSDTLDKDDDFVLLYIPRDVIDFKKYSAEDRAFLSEMTEEIKTQYYDNDIVAHLDRSIGMIEDTKGELSKNGVDDSTDANKILAQLDHFITLVEKKKVEYGASASFESYHADKVIAVLDQYIAMIEQEEVVLSDQAKNDFLVWLRITRNEVVFAKTLVAELKV